MPTLTAVQISAIASQVLCAAGASEGDAKTVADHLADANMTGHDSHGFIRVLQYVRDIRQGWLDPKAQPDVVAESNGLAQVDGHDAFGQVVATFATRLAMEKAREHGISLVTMCNVAHTGRLGAYPEMAAEHGMAAIMCLGIVGGRIARVAPFGGREGRLGTNPISMAFPSGSGAPILMDFATSAAAEGKVRVHRARGQRLPDEWVLSSEGVPSKDPNDLYEGGALLPMGGLTGGHKGYALSFMVGLFGAILPELGNPRTAERPPWGGSTIVVIDLAALAPAEAVSSAVQKMLGFVKDVPAMEGSAGVLHPGQIEAETRNKRLVSGVAVEPATWSEVVELIGELGLEESLGPKLRAIETE